MNKNSTYNNFIFENLNNYSRAVNEKSDSNGKNDNDDNDDSNDSNDYDDKSDRNDRKNKSANVNDSNDSNDSNDYDDKSDRNDRKNKSANVNSVKLSMFCKKNSNLNNSKMNIENIFIKNLNEKLELNILNNVNIKQSPSNICSNTKTVNLNSIIIDDKKKKNEIRYKNIKDNSYKKIYLSNHYSSSEVCHKNMYNHYLFNESCTYLKSKCIKEKGSDLKKIEQKKIIMHNMIGFKDIMNMKNDNKYEHNTKCYIKTEKQSIPKRNLNEEICSLDEKHNYTQCSTLHNDNYDKSACINLLPQDQYKKYNYGSVYPYKNVVRSNSLKRIKHIYLGKKKDSEKNSSTNNSGVSILSDALPHTLPHIFPDISKSISPDISSNNLPKNFSKVYGKLCSKENTSLMSDNTQLMGVNILLNSDNKSRCKKEKTFSKYKDSNFIKFLMAEIKIETKLYKLMAVIFILILLSLSKNISKYMVITRKCYNIYENPIKSIRRILNFIFIFLKIFYKIYIPLYFYLASYIFTIIIRTFVMINILIFFLLLYTKYVLRNGESNTRLYFVFLFNIYKYFFFQVSYFLKNASKRLF